MTDPPKKPQVFISYAKEDEGSARRLYDDLVRHGAEPWLDLHNLLPGQDWQREITHAIQASDHFIALISKHSVNKRGFVQKELRQAITVLDQMPPGHVFVIPARLDETSPTHDKLRKIHWVDLFPWWEDGIRKIGLTMDNFTTSDTTTRTVRIGESPAEHGGKRITLDLPPEAAAEIDRLAEAVNTSAASAVMDYAVGLLRLYVDTQEQGGSLQIERPRGNYSECVTVVLPSTSGK